MTKEFKLNSANIYFKKYIKFMSVIFPLALLAMFRVYTSDYSYKYEFMFVILLFMLIIILKGAISYFLYKKTIYIINDHYLQINKGRKTNIYNFTQLSYIKNTPKDLVRRTGMDVLEIFFDGKKVLKIANDLPFFEEFKEDLINSLKRFGYYNKIKIENEV